MSIPHYFAQVVNGIVTDVRVVNRTYMNQNPDAYLGEWYETFFDVPGKTYAGIGFIYDYDTKDFVSPVHDLTPMTK